MSRAANSVFLFGCYLLGLGAMLLTVPNLLLAAFTLPATDEVWIRVVGMLVLLLGIYYALAARAEYAAFFRWTIYIRCSVIVFFTTFVALGFAPAPLILFGVVDVLGAAWTAVALRRAVVH